MKNKFKNFLDNKKIPITNEQKENYNSSIFSDTNETNSLFEKSFNNNNRK